VSIPEEFEEVGLKFHQRLLAGDIIAFAEIAEYFLPILTSRLSRFYWNIDDPHLIDTAVEDALLNYQKDPAKYDPEKLPLDKYLYMSAKGDLRNLLVREEKYSKALSLAEIVELGPSNTEHTIELSDDPDIETQILINLSPTWAELERLFPEPVDRDLLWLMLEGTRESDMFSEALGITNLPGDEQKEVVKRNKDRIKKRILRHIDPKDLKKS
jgi:hypothetical protein